MKLCSWDELSNEFCDLDKNGPLKYGVLVFNPKESKWDTRKEYSLESRCYIFNSGCKYFDSSMCGNSIFASCLDGTDQCLKLSNYIGSWKSDYCVLLDNSDELKEFKSDPIKVINDLYSKTQEIE